MEKLLLDATVLEQILNDKAALEELKDFLNCVIDEEIRKADDMDCDLIDECVSVMEELMSENEPSAAYLISLISKEKLLKSLKKQAFTRSGQYKKLAAICASAVLLVAVSSVKTDSGQTIARSISNKIASVIRLENAVEHNEPENTETQSTTIAVSDCSDTTTSETTTEEPTSVTVTLEKIYGVLPKNIKTEYKLGESPDVSGVKVFAVYSDGSEKQIPLNECSVTVPESFTKDPGKYKITVGYRGKAFSYNVTVAAQKESVILNSIYGVFSNGFDFRVTTFENLNFDGMTVMAVYSDGSEKEIPLEKCEITVEENFMEISNKALVTVDYEGRSFSFILTKEAGENEEI